MNDDTIKGAMSRAQRTFPSGYWQAYYRGQFRLADSKTELRRFLSEIRLRAKRYKK